MFKYFFDQGGLEGLIFFPRKKWFGKFWMCFKVFFCWGWREVWTVRMVFVGLPGYPLPKTNVGIENRSKPKRKGSFSKHHFSGAFDVSFAECNFPFF